MGVVDEEEMGGYEDATTTVEGRAGCGGGGAC